MFFAEGAKCSIFLSLNFVSFLQINPEEWERFTATEGADPREESAERSKSPPPGDET